MLRRRTPAVSYCLNRAAEAEHRAALAGDPDTEKNYRKLAAVWLRLARNVQFTETLDAMLSEQDK